jgi:hypothetical protein
VTRRELVEAGITPAEVRHRLGTGALLREHPGVFRVGHRAPSVKARYMAAVRACGDGALLSGRAAAHLYGLVRGSAPPPDVTVVGKRRVRGVRTRQARSIDTRDATTFRGIPVTTVARALIDLAADLAAYELARACHEAGVKHRTTPRHVETALVRRPNAPGARKLRRILTGDERITASKLERRFLALVAAENLPLPITNKPAGTRRVDCRWPQVPLTVELDSYTYHRSRYAWEQDRRREREAHARKDEFRRYTYGDVYEDPALMLDELRRLLGALQ